MPQRFCTFRFANIKVLPDVPVSDIGIFLTLTGLFFSRIALSVGMVCLVIGAVGYYVRQGRGFSMERPFWAFSAVFLFFLLTGFYSTDKAFFWERIRLYLPLLVLPYAFSVPLLSKPEAFSKWMFLYFVIVVVTAIVSTFEMLTAHQAISSYTEMRVSTPVNHVRYSLMVAFAVFVGINLYSTWRFQHKFLKTIVLALVIFLILYLHLLAVRSGILGFYFAALLICFRGLFLNTKKKWP